MSVEALAVDSAHPLPCSPVRIPRLGLGIYQLKGDVCINAIISAVRHGYRHIDTAQIYGNEAEVGKAIKKSGIPRRKLFITTKIMSSVDGDVEKTYQSLKESVHLIDEGGYVDMFLIHSPKGGKQDIITMWHALEHLLHNGGTRAIGVSNFGIKQIEELKEDTGGVWPPHVNQIELHPWCQQRDIVQYCMEHGVIVEAYCPLLRNKKANDPTLVSLAEKYNVTTAQILVRYSMQKGWVPLPRSQNPDRITKNADIFGFELDTMDMEKLDALDQGDKGAIVQTVKNQ